MGTRCIAAPSPRRPEAQPQHPSPRAHPRASETPSQQAPRAEGKPRCIQSLEQQPCLNRQPLSPIQQAAALPFARQAGSELLPLQRRTSGAARTTTPEELPGHVPAQPLLTPWQQGEAPDRPDPPRARERQRDAGYLRAPGAGTSRTACGEEEELRGDARGPATRPAPDILPGNTNWELSQRPGACQWFGKKSQRGAGSRMPAAAARTRPARGKRPLRSDSGHSGATLEPPEQGGSKEKPLKSSQQLFFFPSKHHDSITHLRIPVCNLSAAWKRGWETPAETWGGGRGPASRERGEAGSTTKAT